MAGGGVGEAMLIGAAVGAGTGGIMSAAQDKDVGQGMLLGALGGAATGGIGSSLGGAASSAIESAATPAVEAGLTEAGTTAATNTLANTAANTAAENSVNALAQQGSNQAASSAAAMPGLASTPANINTSVASNAAAEGASKGAAGMGQGFFPGMSNANVAGAATTGGISGLMAANAQQAPYEAPGTQPYNGPLSKFKMAGPSLSQYNYDPNSFHPSIAPGFAEGGIADLAQGGVQQTGMFPQSQMDRTQFATPSQMPISREIIGSDYDATISPYTGDLPRFGEGGGINFVHNLQPGGELGSIAADLYGVAQEHEPGFLKDMQPGGFMGALTPGKLDWEEKKRKEEEQKAEEDRAMQEAKKAAMYNQLAGGSASANGGMARGGIADLGSYSDGGRLLRGPGDGMSDNIPASIGGKQPARLADGEFVVPADVVSHLGNGSTDAGAKTLYAMMNKVRKARTGNPKQGKEIDANKYVPGMSDGGIAAFAIGGEVKRYATGNLVYNDGKIGYYNTDEWGNQGEFTPLENSLNNIFQASPVAYKASTYDPNYYNPQFYQNQLDASNQAIQQAQTAYNNYRAPHVGGSWQSNYADLAEANPIANSAYMKYFNRSVDPGTLKWFAENNIDPTNAEAVDKFVGSSGEADRYAAAQKAGLAVQQQNIDAAISARDPIQQNVDRLSNTSIAYNPYTIANRPSGDAPQYYGNIYKIPEGYGQYIREGYDQNAGLGEWNNEYGGPTAATNRQSNIVNQASAQSAASDQALQQAQAAAQKALGNEEKKRRGGIASLR